MVPAAQAFTNVSVGLFKTIFSSCTPRLYGCFSAGGSTAAFSGQLIFNESFFCAGRLNEIQQTAIRKKNFIITDVLYYLFDLCNCHLPCALCLLPLILMHM